MTDKKRSPELAILAVKLYKELRSTQKVAKRLELGASTTYRLLKRAGVDMPDRHAPEVQERKKALHGEKAKKVAEDYAAGIPMAEIKDKHKVGAWAIRTAVKDNGVELRGRGGRWRQFTNKDKAEAVRLYKEDGWTQGQIAAKFNSSQPIVGRLLASLGIKIKNSVRGERHGSWNGGRTVINGYIGVMVSDDDPMKCMAHHTGYVLEHRLVMARYLGRPLTDHETVHHLDDDKANNRLDNLQLRFGRHGKGVVLKCRCCGSSDIVPVEL